MGLPHQPSHAASPRDLTTADLQPCLRGRIRWLQIGCGLLVVAALVASYLAAVALHGSGVAGCGPASSCNRVLQSRWAYWFGIPVSLPAVIAYLALVCSARRRIAVLHGIKPPGESRGIIALAATIIAAAVWFAMLQWVVIHAFCVFCATAHLAAVAGAAILLTEALRAPPASSRPEPRRNVSIAITAAFVGVTLLIAGQLLVVKSTHIVRSIEAPTSQPSSSPSQARGTLSLHGGRIQLDLNSVPRMGSPSAAHVMVSLFDYTCSHCRSTHAFLAAAQKQLGDQLVILTLPMPLDASCNPRVSQTASENINACDYARLGLAVWRARPEVFATFNLWLFTPPRPPPLESARKYAEELVGAAALQLALEDSWIKDQIRIDIELFEANSKRAGVWQMPQLMIGESLSVGSITSEDQLNSILQEQFGLKIGG